VETRLRYSTTQLLDTGTEIGDTELLKQSGFTRNTWG